MTNPAELFCEFGTQIRCESPFAVTMPVELANDACGYVCLRQAYTQGGYEPGSGTNLAEGAGEIVTAEALDLLERMKKGK